jgi:hypothetical protein
MLAAAFLPAAVAVAAPDGGAADISDNAFTGPDGFTFDPGSDGYENLSPIFTNAPLLQLGGGEVNQLPLVTQSFDVYDGSGDDANVGTVDTAANASNLLGLESAQFTVTDDHATADAIQSALSSAGLSDDSFTGGSLSDVAKALADNSGTAGVGGTDALGDDVSKEAVTNTLSLAGGPGGIGLADGTSASDIASALNSADNPLPDEGTVYSITNLTNGFDGETDFGHKNFITDLLGGDIYNVYEATPDSSGDSAAHIQDVLVTPMGNINLSTPFDAIGFVDPTKSFAGLDVGSGNSSDNGSDNGPLGGLLGGLLGNSGSGDEPSAASAAASNNDGSGNDGSGNDGSGGDGGNAGADGGPSDNAFTLGGTTFDPGNSGWDHINPLAGTAPLLEIGGGDLPLTQGTLPSNPVVPAQQDFTVYDGTGDDATAVGSAHTEVNAANILGIQSTQFTVDNVTPVGDHASAGDITSALESANVTDDDVIGGDVSDLGKLLAGNADTDVLGDNLSASDISSALKGSELSLNDQNGLPSGLNADAVAEYLNHAAVDPDASQGDIAAALGNSGSDFSDGDFKGGDLSDVVSALHGDDSTDVLGGGVSAADVSAALGNAGISISDSASFDTPANIANALNSGDIAGTDGNPTDGSVYSVTDFGMGIKNVYEAVPGSGSDSTASIHDTLVTPFGNIDLPTAYDATADLDPGAPLKGLDTNSGNGLLGGLLGNSGSDSDDNEGNGDNNDGGNGGGGTDTNQPDVTAAASNSGDGGAGDDGGTGAGTGAPSDDAFTIGNFTFDPGSDGFDPVSPQFGVAPLLEVSGISTTTPLGNVEPLTQDLDVYSSNGDHLLGSVGTDVQTSNVLGIDTTEFTIDSADPASGQHAADLPDTGTTYSVTDLGFLGIHNVYEAVPGADGGDPTITDILVTPLGNIDLSTPFNALADFMPGDIASGVDAHDNSLFGGLLGGSGSGTTTPETDASANDIQAALSSNSDITAAGFSGDDSSLSDVANALQEGKGTDVLGDDVSANDITSALNDANISISSGADFNASDIADALNDAGTSGAGDEHGMGDGLLGLLGL